MPQISRKRRAPQVEDADPESSSPENTPAARGTQRQRRHEDEGEAMIDNDDVGDGAYGNDTGAAGANVVVPLARKLVRYALSCEYSRQPIRRADISSKVLVGNVNGGRGLANKVFGEAQNMLREVFGMEMVELPAKEKVTMQQRRAAQQKQDKSTATNTYIVVSTLPPKYRDPDIIPPPQIPTAEAESAYVALYTFIIATIALSGGSLPESKLDRCLRRTNADRNTPLGAREKLVNRMIKEQYIVRIRDVSSGEELVEYRIGPRGKSEVGEEGVAGLVRAVYGNSVEDLEKRLDNSLGISAARAAAVGGGETNGTIGTQAQKEERQRQAGKKKRGRPSRNQRAEEEEEDDGDEGEESDED